MAGLWQETEWIAAYNAEIETRFLAKYVMAMERRATPLAHDDPAPQQSNYPRIPETRVVVSGNIRYPTSDSGNSFVPPNSHFAGGQYTCPGYLMVEFGVELRQFV